jgi:type I restriction enzyme S subunit
VINRAVDTAADELKEPAWKWQRLGELCRTTSGGTPSRRRADYFKGTIPWLKSGELPDGFVSEVEEFITEEALADSSAKVFPAGTLLIALYGATVGKLGILTRDAATNQAVCAIFPPNELDSRFLFWYLRLRRSDLIAQAVGGAQPNISQSILGSLDVPVPPVDQQLRIVAEVEKQLSGLDEAVANLMRVKANLKRYKAAVLKAAVEGRLVPTEAELARREGRGYESGQELLRRVLEIRRSHWKGKARYEDPPQPDSTALPNLPEGWAWARLEALASIKGGITVDKKRKDPTSRPVHYLRVANVQRGHLDLTEIKMIDAPKADIEDLGLRYGDMLFNEGGDRDKLGRGWIWESQLPECIHQNHVFRARMFSDEVSPKLVSWWGNTFGRDYFLREGKQTTNLASINMTKLSALPVPVPPPSEQRRLGEETERHLSMLDELSAEAETNLKRATSLSGAVLARAFAGRAG